MKDGLGTNQRVGSDPQWHCHPGLHHRSVFQSATSDHVAFAGTSYHIYGRGIAHSYLLTSISQTSIALVASKTGRQRAQSANVTDGTPPPRTLQAATGFFGLSRPRWAYKRTDLARCYEEPPREQCRQCSCCRHSFCPQRWQPSPRGQLLHQLLHQLRLRQRLRQRLRRPRVSPARGARGGAEATCPPWPRGILKVGVWPRVTCE